MKRILFVLVIFLSSCSRHVFKSQSATQITKDSSYNFYDSSKTITTVAYKKTTRFGDTLNGMVYLNRLNDTVGVEIFDSLESAGIKIRVGIMPTKDGFKARINAISKPVETVETSDIKQERRNDITVEATKKEAIASTTTNKETQSNSWQKMAVIIAFLVFFLLFIFYIIRKKQ